VRVAISVILAALVIDWNFFLPCTCEGRKNSSRQNRGGRRFTYACLERFLNIPRRFLGCQEPPAEAGGVNDKFIQPAKARGS
jgi:hypothetical protein